MNLVTFRFRAVNAIRDLRDRWIYGRCCAAPMMGDGGYHFWRCSLDRGHKGPHRSVNYLWGYDGGSSYSPLDKPGRMLDRFPSLTRRQRREREAWHAARDAERRAASGS